MNNTMTLTCNSRLVGSVDISDPKEAFKEMRRVSLNFSDLVVFGDSRNYVTLREGEVRAVVFYDCFWELPETREEQAFRDMVNAICERAAVLAQVVCRTHDEYIAATNSCTLYEANFLRPVSTSRD